MLTVILIVILVGLFLGSVYAAFFGPKSRLTIAGVLSFLSGIVMGLLNPNSNSNVEMLGMDVFLGIVLSFLLLWSGYWVRRFRGY